MNWRKRFGVEMIAIAVMVVGVSVLAVYQYRWTGEISRTEQERLRNSLATSVRNFDQEFSYDFQQLCESFELDPQPDRSPIESLVELQQAKWNRTSAHPEFVAGVYILKTSPQNAATLEAADQNGIRFHPVSWPQNLQSLREALARRAESSLSAPIADREAVYYPWTFYADGPALVRPIFQTTPEDGNDRMGEVRATGFLVVVLNPEYLARIYFPELVERHFGGPG